jgi:hypothetical protein
MSAKVKLISFADSSLKKSKKRLIKQASELEGLDEIKIYSEKDLNSEFRNRYGAVLKSSVRGFGYWCWKPQIILQELHASKQGDIIVYVDIGCHINGKGSIRFKEYLSLIKMNDNYIIGFQPKNSGYISIPRELRLNWLDKFWTKRDLIDYLGMYESDNILSSETIVATVIILKKDERTVELINEWQDVYFTNFHYLDDTESVNKNLECFREHRHDQAIFSLLAKKAEIKTLSYYELWYPDTNKMGKSDWTKLINSPILAKKDLNLSILDRLKRRIQKKLNEII